MVNLNPSGVFTAVPYRGENEEVKTRESIYSDQPKEELGEDKNTPTIDPMCEELAPLPSDLELAALYIESTIKKKLNQMEEDLQKQLDDEIEARRTIATNYFNYKKKSEKEFDGLKAELNKNKESIDFQWKFIKNRDLKFHKWLDLVESQKERTKKNLEVVTYGSTVSIAWLTFGCLLSAPLSGGTSLAIGTPLVLTELLASFAAGRALAKKHHSLDENFKKMKSCALVYYTAYAVLHPHAKAKEVIKSFQDAFTKNKDLAVAQKV